MNWVDRIEFYIDNHIKQPYPEHTIQTSSGFPLLEKPGPELLELLGKNKRVQYIPSEIPQSWDDGSGRVKETVRFREQIAEERSQGGYYLYYRMALEPLVKQLKADFGEHEYIHLRGFAASLHRTLWNIGTIVRDVDHIVKVGSETPRNETLLTTFFPQEDEARIHERTGQWAVISSLELRSKFEFIKSAASKIYPVVLVYDPDQIGWISGYEFKLPENRDSVVLKGYILDYPYYRRNPRGKWTHPLYLPPVTPIQMG